QQKFEFTDSPAFYGQPCQRESTQTIGKDEQEAVDSGEWRMCGHHGVQKNEFIEKL
ncbi:hypothetical protein VU01_107110, partial [Candidatus Electrothrix marina]